MGDDHKVPPTMEEIRQSIKSYTNRKMREVARLLLEAHQWDVDAAVSEFRETAAVEAAAAAARRRRRRNDPNPSHRTQSSNLGVDIPSSPIRLRSPRSPSRASSSSRSAPNLLCEETMQQVQRYFYEHQHDVDDTAKESDDEKVDIHAASPSSPIRLRSPRSPSRASFSDLPLTYLFCEESIPHQHDVDDTAKESDDEKVETAPLPSPLPRRLKFRSMSEILSVTPQVIPRTVTIWRNGFTLDDNPLSSLDDPLLKEIESRDSPRVFDSADGKQRVVVKLIRRQQEDFPEPFKPFQGVGRALDSASDEPSASSDALTTQPTTLADPTAPTTSIKIILPDGTPIVSRFTTQNTIRDVRDFIDAATPDGSRDYQLIMGFAPKTLTDLDQTIEQAGISNSVLTLKF